MFTRELGKSGIEVSAMGMGCWAIGGPWTYDDEENTIPAGWGKIDDAESIRAIHAGLDRGINFFDTAANYGSGHSERILAKAFEGRRDQVVIATKFGYVIDEERRYNKKDDAAVLANLRQDCENSLRRLDTDYIDLYQFHVGDYDPEQAGEVRDALEELVAEGKIRAYGWSTDNPEGSAVFAQGENCVAVQHVMNVFSNKEIVDGKLAVCDKYGIASIIRSPLAMGILTGKFNPDSKLPDDDVRHDWDFTEGRLSEMLVILDSVRDVLTSVGRTLTQGALGWSWARNERNIPIPGFKTVAQVEENAGAMEFGPLSEDQMREIDEILGRD